MFCQKKNSGLINLLLKLPQRANIFLTNIRKIVFFALSDPDYFIVTCNFSIFKIF